MNRFILYLICLAAAWPLPAVADHLLFEFNDVMELTLPVDFKALCRPREDAECDYIPTTLDYADSHGPGGSIPVEIKVRGGWRSLTRNCSVPLLWIRFNADSVAGTPFEGQGLLPLTTHCGKGLSLESSTARVTRSDWEQYLLKEYLGQRIFELFTEFSVRARLVRIHYPNPDNPRKSFKNYAFFSEHFDSVARRNDAERLPRPSFDHEKLDTQAADQLALYQYMIGNTDWSIVRERNTVLMETCDGRQVPVPYDLDMSGLVNTHYAGPAPGLPIEEVTDRHYLGFCHPDMDWDALFGEFSRRQDAIMQLLEELPGIGRTQRKKTKNFLNGFFDILASDEERQHRIIDDCKPWPPSPVDHTTPLSKR